jgi:hypothetical protein
MKLDIKVTDHSPEVLEALANAIERGLTACGMKGKDYAAAQAPADTGHLRQSMEYAVDGNTCYIGTNAEYAIWQEIGTGIYASSGGGRKTPWFYPKSDGEWGITSGSKPHHMIRDSVANHEDEYRSLLIDSLKNA